MKKKVARFSTDTGKTEDYELVSIFEQVRVKKEAFEADHLYYKRISDGELFEPFDDPDYNLRIDYDLYRERHSLLSSEEVHAVRQKYQLSIREFAALLGVSYANLSAIENGGLQSKYLDTLLRLASNTAAFQELLPARKGDLSSKAYDRLTGSV